MQATKLAIWRYQTRQPNGEFIPVSGCIVHINKSCKNKVGLFVRHDSYVGLMVAARGAAGVCITGWELYFSPGFGAGHERSRRVMCLELGFEQEGQNH